MNDPGSPRWTDPAGLPLPTIYDPGEDETPPFTGVPAPPVVLLLVGEVERRWAARTAVELCSAWAAGGRRIVLADFHLENPLLQDVLGGDDGLEGVVDIFVYGASLARNSHPVAERGFHFIPTGTYTTDADAIFRHGRWPKLVAGFREADATLVVFVPIETADLGALSVWVDMVLLIGAPRAASQLTALRLSGREIRGMIVPPGGESATPAAPPEEGAVRFRPTAPRVLTPSPADEAAEELHLPPPPARTPHRGHRAAVLLLWVLLGAALLTAVGYALVSVRPDLVPWTAVRPPSSADSAPLGAVRAAAAPRPLGVALPYSVHVRAYQNFQAAREQMAELRASAPGILFFISPEEIQGIVYYKVMAGALTSMELAREVKEVLVADGTLDEDEAAGDWTLIQETRYSFVLGEEDSPVEAAAAVDSLLARQVPAYTLPVPFSDGTRRWQLYAGAYRDSVSALALQRQLAEVGLPIHFASRAGSVTSQAQ